MADLYELPANGRERGGKGATRAIRRDGRVPAVIYGDKKDPTAISFAYNDLAKLYNTGRAMATLVNIKLDSAQERVIARDIQLDPVSDRIIHADFLRLGKDAKIAVEVPVIFLNEENCDGLRMGGALNVVRYTVELNCPADAIPEQLEVDLEGLEIGASVHISAITLPDGVTPVITDRDFTVATIAAPSSESDSEDEAAEGEDGEDEAADTEDENESENE